MPDITKLNVKVDADSRDFKTKLIGAADDVKKFKNTLEDVGKFALGGVILNQLTPLFDETLNRLQERIFGTRDVLKGLGERMADAFFPPDIGKMAEKRLAEIREQESKKLEEIAKKTADLVNQEEVRFTLITKGAEAAERQKMALQGMNDNQIQWVMGQRKANDALEEQKKKVEKLKLMLEEVRQPELNPRERFLRDLDNAGANDDQLHRAGIDFDVRERNKQIADAQKNAEELSKELKLQVETLGMSADQARLYAMRIAGVRKETINNVAQMQDQLALAKKLEEIDKMKADRINSIGTAGAALAGSQDAFSAISRFNNAGALKTENERIVKKLEEHKVLLKEMVKTLNKLGFRAEDIPINVVEF